MTSVSSRKGDRSFPYEKMLMADAFLIVGFTLLSFGLGLSFYHVPVIPQDEAGNYLSLENSYSQNFSFQLEQGDTLLVGVKAYAPVNLTLLLTHDVNPQPLLVLRAGASVSLINFSYRATVAGEYKVIVFENTTDPSNRATYCDFEIMSIVALSSPVRPYPFYGIVLVCAGLLSLVYSKKTGMKVREVEEWFEWSGYILPVVFLISSIGFALLSSWFIVTSPSQIGVVEGVLLVMFSAANVYSLLVAVTTSQGRSLLLFLRSILVASIAWIAIVSLLIYLLPSIISSGLYYWDPSVFLSSLETLANMGSTLFQVESLVAMLVVFYCLSFHYGNQRAFSYLLEVEAVEAGTLKGLSRKLDGALRKKDLEEFFNRLREEDLEASVFLFFLLSDHIASRINSFTYHSAIAERRSIFSKDIYDRKPVEKVLEPLGLMKVIGGERFKTFKLRSNRPNVIRLLNLFKESDNKGEKDKVAEWAGVTLLRERRMKYSGLTREKESY
nr:hypothetical protein [Candidatus Njordarchaeota archaeon]